MLISVRATSSLRRWQDLSSLIRRTARVRRHKDDARCNEHDAKAWQLPSVENRSARRPWVPVLVIGIRTWRPTLLARRIRSWLLNRILYSFDSLGRPSGRGFSSARVIAPTSTPRVSPRVMEHGRGFIAARLAPAQPRNDGRQTPMRGHPIFVAQHATATCCRSCLAKWHGIPAGQALSDAEQNYVLAVIARWLDEQLSGRMITPPAR